MVDMDIMTLCFQCLYFIYLHKDQHVYKISNHGSIAKQILEYPQSLKNSQIMFKVQNIDIYRMTIT